MFKIIVVIYCISLFLVSVPVHSLANENTCLIAYERMTIEVENSASASRAGDVCRAADCLERALNWLGTCENECAYSRERMKKIYQYKKEWYKIFAAYIKQCGH